MLEEDPLPPPTTGWERRRRDTRREVIAASWELCRAQGLSALSMRDLAGRVGMRAPSLYSYFDSKEAIYDAMFAQGQRELVEHMSPIADRPATRAELRAGVRRFVDFCLADPVRYQLMFQRPLPGFTPSEESYALAVGYLARVERQLRHLGVRRRRHLDLWTAIITGLIDQQISNDLGGTRWSRLVDEVVDLFCDHVGVPADAALPTSTRPTRHGSSTS